MNTNLLLRTTLVTLLTAATFTGSADNGVTLQPLSESHSLVRVNSNDRYLLLPIEEAAHESRLRIVVDGKLVTTITARLAENHGDYMVPLDLSAYAGRHIVVDVRADVGREAQRSISNAVWNKQIATSDTFDTSNTELQWRPVYHHTPRYAWMNDPNGMFYHDGVWHLCYQFGPYGSTWNNMTWGHSVSSDLMHWEQVDDAIRPDALGMIFSGSSVVDSLNSAGYGRDAIIAMYTQADMSQFQSMAYSTDGGMTFTPYSGNPVLTQPYEARDPHMFYCHATKRWTMVLASALEHEMDIYSSPDLKTWTKESSFGKGYGCQDGVWECPDLLELPVRGENEKAWVLICNINPGGPFGGSATQYFTGTFDGHQFICDTPKEVTKWMDYGKDHYAAVSWNSAPDGRHTMIAWMSNWQYANQVPTKQYRSANTLPRDVELYRGRDGRLYLASTPSPEVEGARGTRQGLGTVSNGTRKSIPQDCRGAFELDVTLTPGKNKQVSLILANNLGEEVVMTVDTKENTFSMNRGKSGETSFSDDFNTVTTAPLATSEPQELRVFVDKSSIEVFEKEGRYTMTNIVFPNEPYSVVKVDGGKATMTIYPIK